MGKDAIHQISTNLRSGIASALLALAAFTCAVHAYERLFGYQVRGDGVDELISHKTYAEETRNEYRLKTGLNF